MQIKIENVFQKLFPLISESTLRYQCLRFGELTVSYSAVTNLVEK